MARTEKSGAVARARGAATVEAVIVLPFFIIVLVSVLFVRDKSLARHAADAQARSCAWRYSVSACGAVPAGCEAVLTMEQGPDSSLRDLLDGDLHAVSSFLGPVLDVVSGLLGDVLGHIEKDAVAETNATVDLPPLYGGGQIAAIARYRLACNLEPREAPNVVKAAADLFDLF